MSWGAFVFGDLRWPMPDFGMVAVWRAMSMDASKWCDWDGFVDDVGQHTIAELIDQLLRASSDAPFTLELDEHGAKLRAYLDETNAACWQQLAVAWRAAADLGATGEFVWMPGPSCPHATAYLGVIADYESRWQSCASDLAPNLAARREIEAMLPDAT
jgi:hypothetical protein